MSLKSDKLAKRIQAIQQFIAGRIDQNDAYIPVSQELVKLAESLAAGKIIIQIISTASPPTQALHNFLSHSQVLADICQLQTAALPSKPPRILPKLSPILTLKVALDSIKYHPLPRDRKVIIGRNPEICDLLIPDNKTLVSGDHAQVNILVNSDNSDESPVWQICDYSRNGTYINGQKINQECRILAQGDLLNLGEATLSDKSVEIVFNLQRHLEHEADNFPGELVNCDLLCLVVNSSQQLTIDEKWFLEKATQSRITKIAIILEISTPEQEITQQIEAKSAELETCLKSQYPTHSFELVNLLLQPFYPEAEVTEIERTYQKELDKFTKSLETLVKRRPEDILSQRIDVSVGYQLSKMIGILETEGVSWQQKIEEGEAQIQRLEKDVISERVKKAMRKVSEIKDRFFRRIKDRVNDSKDNLLNPYLPSSISAKIEQFSSTLTKSVTDKRGFRTVKLKINNNNDNENLPEAAVTICQKELEHWAIPEWQNIQNLYRIELLQPSAKLLNCIDSVSLPKSLFKPFANLNVQSVLQNSFVEHSFESRYKQPNALGYVFRNLRSSIIATVSIIMLFVAGFLPKDLLPNQIKPSIIMISIPILLVFIWRGYHHETSVKLEDETNKLKKDFEKYYLSLAKDLADKLVKNMAFALESEDQRITEVLETVEEQYKAYLSNIEKTKLEIKAKIAQYNQQVRSLDTELQRLKRL